MASVGHLAAALVLESIGTKNSIDIYFILDFPVVIITEKSQTLYDMADWMFEHPLFGVNLQWYLICMGTVFYAAVGGCVGGVSGLLLGRPLVRRPKQRCDNGMQDRGDTSRDGISTYRDPDAQY